MILFRLLLITFLLNVVPLFSQKDTIQFNSKKQNKIYLLWGYTRAWYTKSNIHFQNKGTYVSKLNGNSYTYDFTAYQAVAKDRPDFDQLYDVINITIPQFVGRLGYKLNDKWDIEMNYDHTKYVVTDFQKLRVKGQINNQWFDTDTILSPTNLFHFEHTDGANFWMINAVRKFKLFQKNPKFKLEAVVKPGGGIVIPRTDVTLFGERLNNDWKVAGYIFGVESGIRINFLKYGLFELTTKGSYANYVNAFVLGKGNGKVNHHFFAGQVTATFGVLLGK